MRFYRERIGSNYWAVTSEEEGHITNLFYTSFVHSWYMVRKMRRAWLRRQLAKD